MACGTGKTYTSLKIAEALCSKNGSVLHIDGGMNALYRSRMIEWLREANEETGCRILSKTKCLSEGVDVPGLDAVIFLSPKNSFVEVVQAWGLMRY